VPEEVSMLEHRLDEKDPERSKKLFLGFIAASIVVAITVGLVSLIPSREQEESDMLREAFREGSAEFEALTRRIIAETDYRNTTESTIPLGTVMMSIAGTLKNRSDKVITGLQVTVAVLDVKGGVIKERAMVVIPSEKAELAPGEELRTVVRMDGFTQNDGRAGVKWKVTAIRVAE
jgi:hypothetical protein